MAGRIGALGFEPPVTSRMVAAESYLQPHPHQRLSSHGHVAVLVDHYRRVECELRDLVPFVAAELGDPVTADLLTGALAELERDLWALESHLEPGPLVELDGTADPRIPDSDAEQELPQLPPVSSLTH